MNIIRCVWWLLWAIIWGVHPWAWPIAAFCLLGALCALGSGPGSDGSAGPAT